MKVENKAKIYVFAKVLNRLDVLVTCSRITTLIRNCYFKFLSTYFVDFRQLFASYIT
jgi:hypothetical protein